MLASLIALGLAATAAPVAAPEAKAQREPLLVAHPDGSWSITRTIEEDAPSLQPALDALLAEEPEFAGPRARDTLRAQDLEAEAEEAFEDAVDAARRDERPE